MANSSTLFNRRRNRVRSKLKRRSRRTLRLSVFRSNKHIYAQLIDDTKGVTLASASTVDKELASKLKQTSNIEAAKAVGALIAARAKTAKVKEVVFDRGGYLFHGKVKALAEAARENGLVF